VFDIKHMVVTNLVRDKALLNRMFQQTGGPEFRFLVRMGLPLGLLIGLVQSVAFALTNNDWLLPGFGLFTGASTDFIALRMIFRPKQSRGIGPLRWQGLFHKRRTEVSVSYSALIADEILALSRRRYCRSQNPTPGSRRAAVTSRPPNIPVGSRAASRSSTGQLLQRRRQRRRLWHRCGGAGHAGGATERGRPRQDPARQGVEDPESDYDG
jgi:hypothetical protein